MIIRRGIVGLLAGVGAVPVLAAESVKSAPVTVEPVGAGGIVEVLLALLLVLLLIVGMAWLMRRFSSLGYGGSSAIRILGGVPVGQRERVILVQVGETQLVLGVAPGRVQTLHVLDKPVSAAPVPTGGESFAERLNAVLKRGGH